MDNNWFDRPMRWAQLTFTEDDPAHIDLDFWLDYFQQIHADGAVLSSGGYMAYYPTQIPLHHRSRWLGEADLFGDAVAGCRKMGMAVIARTDPHAVHQDVYDAHPGWIAVDAEGNPRPHWSTPDVWVTCALGPYNFEYMTQVNNEIMRFYQVDGIFGNRWAGSGMCYCQHCQRNFFDAHGLDLPRSNDPQDPAHRAYLQWRQERLFALWHLWDSELRAINPNGHYIPNSGGGALSPLNMKTVGQMARILFADRQGRGGIMPPWTAGKNGKEYRATLGNKPVGGIFSVGVAGGHRWKDSVQHEAELRLWVADGIANGLRPWFTKFSAGMHDDRWLKVVKEIYQWHHQAEAYLRNEASLARVGLVYSQQTAAFYGGQQAREKVEASILGFYQALIEARIPFDMVHDELLDAEQIDRFKVLILPDIAALSDDQCQQLQEYVARGGSLVATFETSRYDERGERRETLGLADLFGVEDDGGLEGPMKNAYLRLEADPATGARHPLLAGLENAQRLIHGVHRLRVRPVIDFPETPLTLVPAYPDLPMEEVYPRRPQTDIAEVYVREIGQGRIVYFPWDIDRTFWEILNVDHGRLLANAVRWASNESPHISVAGTGVLDVTVWRQQASITVHLVNLTNPMMMRGPFRELIPVGQQTVRLRLPEGKKAGKVHLLRAGAAPQMEEIEGELTIIVPSILDHEVVAIDLR